MSDQPQSSPPTDEGGGDRRSLFSTASNVVMAAGLAASYGTFAYMAGKFLYPRGSTSKAWMFVCETAKIAKGESLKFQAPSGAKINIARVGDTDDAESFVALSSVCPHLGCQVHWESQNNRFFCPCHNGVFAPDGKGIGGPPGDAGQSLPRYELRVRNGLLYMWVETETLTASGILDEPDYPRGSGHDPCLAPGNPEVC